MNELNPNHPVTAEMHDSWHKLCAMVMFKFGVRHVEITAEEIESFASSGACNIVLHPKGDVLTVFLVSDAEAERLAREEGGLPV